MSHRLRFPALASLLILAAVGLANGQDPSDASDTALGVERDLGQPAGRPLAGAELQEATHELGSTLRCPVCQGLSVADSSSASALAMREEIEELFSAGYTSDQIADYFERSYGEFVRLVPKAQGFNLVVWLLPAFGVLIGAVFVVRQVKRRESSAPIDDDAELDRYREQVRRELAG